jgi:hypothetical protein
MTGGVAVRHGDPVRFGRFVRLVRFQVWGWPVTTVKFQAAGNDTWLVLFPFNKTIIETIKAVVPSAARRRPAPGAGELPRQVLEGTTQPGAGTRSAFWLWDQSSRVCAV